MWSFYIEFLLTKNYISCTWLRFFSDGERTWLFWRSRLEELDYVVGKTWISLCVCTVIWPVRMSNWPQKQICVGACVSSKPKTKYQISVQTTLRLRMTQVWVVVHWFKQRKMNNMHSYLFLMKTHKISYPPKHAWASHLHDKIEGLLILSAETLDSLFKYTVPPQLHLLEGENLFRR